MQSIYRAMDKSAELRLICFALILFVLLVAGSIQSRQPNSLQNIRPGYTLQFPKRQPYTVIQDRHAAIWTQGTRRVCL